MFLFSSFVVASCHFPVPRASAHWASKAATSRWANIRVHQLCGWMHQNKNRQSAPFLVVSFAPKKCTSNWNASLENGVSFKWVHRGMWIFGGEKSDRFWCIHLLKHKWWVGNKTSYSSRKTPHLRKEAVDTSLLLFSCCRSMLWTDEKILRVSPLLHYAWPTCLRLSAPNLVVSTEDDCLRTEHRCSHMHFSANATQTGKEIVHLLWNAAY